MPSCSPTSRPGTCRSTRGGRGPSRSSASTSSSTGRTGSPTACGSSGRPTRRTTRASTSTSPPRCGRSGTTRPRSSPGCRCRCSGCRRPWCSSASRSASSTSSSCTPSVWTGSSARSSRSCTDRRTASPRGWAPTGSSGCRPTSTPRSCATYVARRGCATSSATSSGHPAGSRTRPRRTLVPFEVTQRQGGVTVERRADDSEVGVGPGPLSRIPEAARQAVLDAAAVLQVRRSEAAAQVACGELPDVVIVARGLQGINDWIREASTGWRELLSVRPGGTAAELRVTLPHNRVLVNAGLRMVSIFHRQGLEVDARVLLANEPVGTYLYGIAPVQMKIVDRRFVLLQGPVVDGESTLMTASSAACLEAAWRYWQATLDSSFAAGSEGVGALGDLSPRQRQIVALLATGTGDEAIAVSLGVSVRTVRSDIAALLDLLGVKTRFAAGIRLQLWSDHSG